MCNVTQRCVRSKFIAVRVSLPGLTIYLVKIDQKVIITESYI